jgi:spermidine synthase
MHADDSVTTVARATEDGYEIALRRRRRGNKVVDELIIDGVFAMDSDAPLSEVALAEAIGPNPGRVLVGGLGLGFTAAALLARGATHLDIVELSRSLIDWAHAGLAEPLATLSRDERVTLHQGDVAELLNQQPTLPGLFGPWAAICLDIDNGPDFLIHDHNARLYTVSGLRSTLSHLVPGGKLALWSQGPSKELWFDLVSLDPGATERLVPVDRQNRRIDYAIYTLSRID